jgi:hypothetical protein
MMERLRMQVVKGVLVFTIIIAGKFQSCSEDRPGIKMAHQPSEHMSQYRGT